MKKNILSAALVAAMTLAAMTSCNKAQNSDDQSNGKAPAVPAELKIAYVEVDSIMVMVCSYWSAGRLMALISSISSS